MKKCLSFLNGVHPHLPCPSIHYLDLMNFLKKTLPIIHSFFHSKISDKNSLSHVLSSFLPVFKLIHNEGANVCRLGIFDVLFIFKKTVMLISSTASITAPVIIFFVHKEFELFFHQGPKKNYNIIKLGLVFQLVSN